MAGGSYFEASAKPALVQVDPVKAVAVEGIGAPGGEAHMRAISVLYGAVERVAERAAELGVNFAVPPLEGLWWVEDTRPPFEVPREEWHWQLFIQVPGEVDLREIPLPEEARPLDLDEGLCVQALHKGAYATEPETLTKMDALMAQEGLEPHGRHHEIYVTPITDAPNKGRTILRQPAARRS